MTIDNSLSADEKSYELQKVFSKDEKKLPYWPYWYIHGRLYDLVPWLREHPGGKDFLLRLRGTDCTAAFETHHIRMERARTMLDRFEIGLATRPSERPQFDWQNYGALRGKVSKALEKHHWQFGPTLLSRLMATLCLLICIAIPLYWSALEPLQWLLAPIYLIACLVIGAFGHVFLHQNTRWAFMADLFGISSHDWKVSHCLYHHLYTNHPELDPDVRVLEPLVNFSPGYGSRLQRFAPFLVLPVYALGFMILRFTMFLNMRRNRQQILPRLFWYIVGKYGLLTLWWTGGHLAVGIVLECAISFTFIAVTMSTHNHSSCHALNGLKDFATYQIRAARDFGGTSFWKAVFPGAFLGNQSLHHLFPTLDPLYHPIVQREVCASGYPYRRYSGWKIIREHFWFMAHNYQPLEENMSEYSNSRLNELQNPP